MVLIVDTAKEDDVESIVKLVDNWLGEIKWPWQADRSFTIRNILKDRNHEILVAKIDNRVAGVLHQHFYLDILHGGLMSHINFLLVDKEYRGKGVGSKLLHTALKNAKERMVMEIHVDTIFEEAAKFYRKHGFKDDGVYLELNFKRRVSDF
jgi:GNAT superfamily N-acetyltransferase